MGTNQRVIRHFVVRALLYGALSGVELAVLACHRAEKRQMSTSRSAPAAGHQTRNPEPAPAMKAGTLLWQLSFARQTWPVELDFDGASVTGNIQRGSRKLDLTGMRREPLLAFSFSGPIPDGLSDTGTSVQTVRFEGRRDGDGYTGQCQIRREIPRAGKQVPLEETDTAVLRPRPAGTH